MVKCQHSCRKSNSVSDHEQTFKFFFRQMHKENMWVILGSVLQLIGEGYFVDCCVRCWCVVRCFKSNLISSDRISVIDQISTILHVSSQTCWCSIRADGHHERRFCSSDHWKVIWYRKDFQIRLRKPWMSEKIPRIVNLKYRYFNM